MFHAVLILLNVSNYGTVVKCVAESDFAQNFFYKNYLCYIFVLVIARYYIYIMHTASC